MEEEGEVRGVRQGEGYASACIVHRVLHIARCLGMKADMRTIDVIAQRRLTRPVCDPGRQGRPVKMAQRRVELQPDRPIIQPCQRLHWPLHQRDLNGALEVSS